MKLRVNSPPALRTPMVALSFAVLEAVVGCSPHVPRG